MNETFPTPVKYELIPTEALFDTFEINIYIWKKNSIAIEA
jgi:hypothetical protein